MLETTKAIIKEMDEVMDAYMKQMLSFEDLMDLDDEETNLLKRTWNLMDMSKKLMLEQAEAFDKINEMDEKMDKIIKLLEKK